MEEELVEEEESAHIGAKIKKLQEKLKISQKERAEYLDGWQRAKADYVNLKKSYEEKQKDLRLRLTREIVTTLLPLLDSLSRALNSASKEGKSTEEGIALIKAQYEGILLELGIEVINTPGGVFDPSVHESVLTEEAKEKDDDHKVVEIVEKGYKIGELLVRPAKVKVALYKN